MSLLRYLKQRIFSRPGSDAPLPEQVGFDRDWYLHIYPDVAQAGIDPWQHYYRHGRFEGRLPHANRAAIYDYHLWRGLDNVMVPRLQRLVSESPRGLEADFARWALARWFAWQGQPEQVAEQLRLITERPLRGPSHRGPYLLYLDAALALGRPDQAQQALTVLQQQHPGCADAVLATCNLLAHKRAPTVIEPRLKLLNQFYQGLGLLPLRAEPVVGQPLFDGLAAAGPVTSDFPDCPLISVVVPLFNAGPRLETALRGLHQQTWRNLEVLVVDDASTDGSAALAEEWCQRLSGPGREFRLLRHAANGGAYAARNTGMAQARGAFLTVQDADDWSHPQKLEKQVAVLLGHPDAMASVSHWVRADENLLFGYWRVEEGWVYRNVSSLMIRRQVLDELGFWDEVAVNADTEYYYRILAAWGAQSIKEVLPGIPLSFGRADSESLSQHRQTHLISQFGGVRKDYLDAAHRWHARAKAPADLYLAAAALARPFLAPKSLCRRDLPVTHSDDRDLVQQSDWFDAAWYIRRYPDLQEVALDAFDHWWQRGAREGRDPGPRFSSSGYQWLYGQDLAGANPLLHFLTVGREAGREPVPLSTGLAEVFVDRPWVMLCGHQAGESLFGAERSLLDILAGLQALCVNVLVVLPEARNPAYLDQLQQNCQWLGILPMAWWQFGAEPEPLTQSVLEHWIRQFGVSRVYVNTVVLHEPSRAARACGIPVTVHARELPGQDPALCHLLNASPEQVRQHTLDSADLLVANSRYLADFYSADANLLVPNVVDASAYRVPLPAAEQLRVGLISSNLPKKGVADFVALASELEARGVAVTCVLIGPETDEVRRLRAEQAAGRLPLSVEFGGYAQSPQAALAKAHVVVNLSQFEESFGRTVLEAMAAERPVVCYARGALPELVVQGETGFVVPFGDVSAVADAVQRLALEPDLRQRMGQAGRKRAETGYSRQVMEQCLQAWLDI